MRRVLGALAPLLAGAALTVGIWAAERHQRPTPLNLDAVVRSAKAACAPMELEGGRTDGRTYFTFTCQREVDLGVYRPGRGGKVAPAPVPP